MRLIVRLIDHLAGRDKLWDGGLLLGRLRSLTPPKPPATIFVDFSGILLATASALHDAVFAFRDHVVRSRTAHLVVSNMSPQVERELEFLVGLRGDVLWSCRLEGAPPTVSVPKIIGELDELHRYTLYLVTSFGSATASDLAEQHRRPGTELAIALRAITPGFPRYDIDWDRLPATATKKVGVTAWNNRLSSLEALGLVTHRREGKAKILVPLLVSGTKASTCPGTSTSERDG
jgi:hypothetical protein